MDPPINRRGKRMMRALIEASKEATVRSVFHGDKRVLVLYGGGTPPRMAAMKSHLSRGGRVVAWDLGYWDRDEAMRVAFDGYHPTAAQMAKVPGGSRRGFYLREDANPKGPVLLIGLGEKSNPMLGLAPMEWEKAALESIKRTYPWRKVLFRPKGRNAIPLEGTTLCHGGAIEQAMAGCSLVVCRHSNVAVDACIAGIPVWCFGGAAEALYGETSNPSRDDRAEFLRRLSWFNWSPGEAKEAVAFMERMTA